MNNTSNKFVFTTKLMFCKTFARGRIAVNGEMAWQNTAAILENACYRS